jgi:hypothetical protein
VNEAIELRGLVKDTLRFPMGCVLVNSVYPELLGDKEEEGAQRERLEEVIREMEGDPTLRPLLQSTLSVQRRRAMNRSYINLMASTLDEPMILLPFLFSREFGSEAVEMLADCLADQITP